MTSGYFGKILVIDLSDERIDEETLPDKLYRQFIGGYGLGCKLLYERMKPNIDPLNSDSIIGFFPGLLTGTAAPYSGRYMVVGKSPLTGSWGDANGGGTFGPAIKKCGYDGILITGAASKPVYISVIDDKKEILDATGIWGLDIVNTEEKLEKIHGRNIKSAEIGLSGEKLSKISGIASDKGRIAARSGLGAVMGSKNLKAIVLKGNKKVNIDDKENFMNLIKNYYHKTKIKELTKIKKAFLSEMFGMVKSIRRLKVGMFSPPNLMRTIYRFFGTSIANCVSAEIGDSPIKNWTGIGMYDFPHEKSKNISTIEIGKYKIKEYGCFSCPVQCGAILKIPELNIEATHIPEYETCSSFGSLLLNNDLLSIFKINDLCNRAAIDTISTGATIAFAIECYEKGIITTKDTDGLELTWGNSTAITELVRKIITREGIGDILADGCKEASKKIGLNSEQFAITSLGSELPMHNPKYFESLAFTYAFDPTPGRHTAASIDFSEVGPIDRFENKIKLPKKRKQNLEAKIHAQYINTGFHQVLSCAGLCLFSISFGVYPFIDLINSLTGWDMSIEEYISTGLRIQTLRQAFTLREGIDLANNELSRRVIGNPPDTRGPLKGKTIEYKEFYGKFCEKIGWNPENGYPLEKTLKDFDLGFVIKDLY